MAGRGSGKMSWCPRRPGYRLPVPSVRPGAAVEAALERITYANEETGYTIARVATDRSGSGLLTVVGSLLGYSRGEPAAGRLVKVARGA